MTTRARDELEVVNQSLDQANASITRLSDSPTELGPDRCPDLESAQRKARTILGHLDNLLDIARRETHDAPSNEPEPEELRDRMRRQIEDVAQANLSISNAIAGLPEASIQSVLQTVALEARALTSAEFAAIGIGGDPGHPFETWAVSGITREQAAAIGRNPRPIGLLGLVMREDRVFRLRDLRAHQAHKGFPVHHPAMTSFLAVPIRYKGRATAILFLANKRGGGEFTEQDESLAGILGNRVGVAIETARLYAAEGRHREWFQAVVDQMPDGVALMNADGHVIVENRSMRSLAAAQPQGRDRFGNAITVDLRYPSGERMAPDDLPIVKAMVHQQIIQGQELAVWQAGDRVLPVVVSAVPVRIGSGDLAGAVMILQDVSKLKELERLHEEWSSTIAHDLQQPISAIALRCEVLLQAGLGEKESEDVRQVLASAKRLSGLVSDLVDASLLDTHHLKMTLDRVDFGQLARDVVGRIPEAGPHTRIQTPADHSVCVRGDAQRLAQVLTSLLSNAVQCGTPDPEIHLDVMERDGEAEVVVASRVVKTSTKGSELGLHVAKGLVEAQGGRIWAESTPGTATFHFTVPLDARPTP